MEFFKSVLCIKKSWNYLSKKEKYLFKIAILKDIITFKFLK
jgi:hypothetical protein